MGTKHSKSETYSMETGATTVPYKNFWERHNIQFVKTAKYLVVSVFLFFFCMFGLVFLAIGATCDARGFNCKLPDAHQYGYVGGGVTIIMMSLTTLLSYTQFKKWGNSHQKARYVLITMEYIVFLMLGLCLVSITSPPISGMKPMLETALKCAGIVMTISSSVVLIFITVAGITDWCKTK